MKTFTNATTSATYVYNGLGDRLRETVSGVTTTFTMDLNTGLTQALSDGTNTYIYGVGRIAQINTSTEYFLGDALGSVRQLTDVGGAITYARAYNPYGVVTSTTGPSQSAYGFTGEVYGDSTQLTYLRARYYSSNTGRFISRDTWSGNAEIPMSFNKWNYVGGNPVNLTDPSGNFPPLWCQFMPNRAFYEGCVDLWYGIEPITHLGEYVVGERGCYTGPFEYRAPGHFQGTGLTLALPWIVNWRFEVESVYDFATFEHSYFINGTDQIPVLPGIGASDFVWGGMLDQYAGFVSGFRTDTSIGSDYSGPALTGFFGASAGLAIIDPFGPSVGIGIAGFVSLSDPRVRGAGVYVSIGFGVDAFPFAYDGGFGLLSLTNRPFTVTNYKNDNNSINKARLFYDIISARHDIWVQGFNPQTYAAGFPSRTTTAMMALTYVRVYEEIRHGIK